MRARAAILDRKISQVSAKPRLKGLVLEGAGGGVRSEMIASEARIRRANAAARARYRARFPLALRGSPERYGPISTRRGRMLSDYRETRFTHAGATKAVYVRGE